MGPGMYSDPVSFSQHSFNQCLIALNLAANEEENGFGIPFGKDVQYLLCPARLRPVIECQIDPSALPPAFSLQPYT